MIFLVFDLFGRDENYGYLSYIVAVIPVNYFWAMGGNALFAYILLFIFWIASILRDTIGVYLKKDKEIKYLKKDKEINSILLYLTLGILIQLIITSILPATIDTEKFWFFSLPNVHSAIFEVSMVTGFKITATILVFLVIVPLILDVKDEEIPLPIVIIFVAIFIIPFLYLSYIWIPEATGVLTFLFSVVLFVILLLITRGQGAK